MSALRISIGIALLAILLPGVIAPHLAWAGREDDWREELKQWKGNTTDDLLRLAGPPEGKSTLTTGNEIWSYRFDDDECKATFEIGAEHKIQTVNVIISKGCPRKYVLQAPVRMNDLWRAAVKKWNGASSQDVKTRLGEPAKQREAFFSKNQLWTYQFGSADCQVRFEIDAATGKVTEAKGTELEDCPPVSAIDVKSN